MIKSELGIEPEVEPGDRGKFEVFLDGTKIAERKQSVLSRLFGGGGWPNEHAVVQMIKART